MWIRLIAAVTLTLVRAHPYTTIQPDVEIQGAANISGSSTPETPGPTIQTVETGSSEEISDDFSHLVAILHDNFLLGAGAIVGEKWIIATAFQLGAFNADQLVVRVGSTSAVSGGQLIAVDQLFPHPMFRQFNNDVALVKTKEVVVPSDSVRLIPVAEAPPDMGDGAMLSIWSSDTAAQKNLADILPVSDCRAFYPDFDLTESNICAVLDHVLPFQVGLYGSPLVYNGSLVGLYMGVAAGEYKPSLCSNLSPLVGWVHAMLKNETATQLLFPLSD